MTVLECLSVLEKEENNAWLSRKLCKACMEAGLAYESGENWGWSRETRDTLSGGFAWKGHYTCYPLSRAEAKEQTFGAHFMVNVCCSDFLSPW